MTGNASVSTSPYTQAANYLFEQQGGNHYIQGVTDTVTVSDAAAEHLRWTGASTLSGAASVSAGPSLHAAASATCVGTSSIIQTAKVIHQASTTLTGSASCSANAVTGKFVFAPLAAAASVSATAIVLHRTHTACAGAASTSATATVEAEASTTCAASASTTFTGHLKGAGAATILAAATLTGASTDVENVPVSDSVLVSDQLAVQYIPSTNAALPGAATVSSSAFAARAGVASPTGASTVTAMAGAGHHAQVGDTVVITDHAVASHSNPTSVSDTVTIAAAGVTLAYGGHAMVSDTISVSDSVHTGEQQPVVVSDMVVVHDQAAIHYTAGLSLTATVPVSDNLQAGAISVVSSSTLLTVGFPLGLRVSGTNNLSNYSFSPFPGGGGFPFTILSAEPVTNLIASGSEARVVGSNTLQIPDGTFSPANVGDYINLSSRANTASFLRITEVIGANEVVVSQPLIQIDPQNGGISWQHTSPVMGLSITTTKQTNGAKYGINVSNLMTSDGLPFSVSDTFTAVAQQPSVTSVELLPEGQVLITFSDPMLKDTFLTSPAEYSITGPSTVRVESVQTPAPNQVALITSGLGSGSYTVTVNANGTPHDEAGNPISPLFNQAVFTGVIPLAVRSIFTDMGPIAKAPNIYQTGTQATVVDPVTLKLADGNLIPSMLGLLVTISGGTKNGGTFLITSVPTNTTVKVAASFALNDSTLYSWQVFDPMDGQIADDPSDVVVTINGVPTPALDVVGLLGQIILPTVPADGDKVLVNYNWVQNPVIDLRRMNSREFRFNSWNRDLGYIPDPSRHKYRFNNTLAVPSEYVLPTPVMTGTGAQILTTTEFNLPGAALSNADVDLTVRIGGVNGGDYIIASVIDATHLSVQSPVQIYPDPGSGSLSWEVFDPNNLDERAALPQPLQRGLKYRAYERAYTALLNDPGTLLFNVPTNTIAYPPLQRPLSSSFISYEPTGLPQNDPVAPWTLNGQGTATILNDELIVTSSSAGPLFPGGQPIFWSRLIDLTFPNVFAFSWRLTVNQDPTPEGVFTGVAAGFSDGERCCLVGFLDNAGTHMIGILKAGTGNDPSQLSSWTGGLDSSGNATNAPAAFEWGLLHSYRIYQDQTGNVSVFVDGGVVATLLIPEADLPFLSELNEPFNALQGAFFGVLSRLAVSTSTWDFVRYEILPINPQQVAPSLYVSYEATTPPETASQPWTPLGAHGTETISHPGLLILDSTSATNQATEVLSGLINGDFRGFDRIEPLLSAASSVDLDTNVQLLTWTHGIAPNAVMVTIDDSNYLIQLSFFPSQASPLFSYGGRSLPDQFQPYTWTKMGGQTPTIIGQYLQIADASTTDGLLYAIDDNPTPSAPNRVVAFSNDYILEFRVQVISFTADTGGFCGVNAEVYDSSRDLGVMFTTVAGVTYVALHSEGVVVAQFPFNWNDTNWHTYRMVKSTSGNLVTLFVDTVLIGTSPYSSFTAPTPTSPIGVISFGSTTPISVMSLSVVNWAYCNAWRVLSTLHHYVGFWKGFDPNALTGYHLPLKTSGLQARIGGNGVEDLNATFVTDGVVPGDVFIVDVGPNKGVYEIVSVAQTVLTVAAQVFPPILGATSQFVSGATVSGSAGVVAQASANLVAGSEIVATAVRDTTLIASSSLSAAPALTGHSRVNMDGGAGVVATATVTSVPVSPSPFPVQPAVVNYRIPGEVDWTEPHRYRIVRDPGGGVALFVDNLNQALIDIGYNNIDLPPSSAGLSDGIAGGLPSVVWGAFDPTNLSQTAWQYMRYAVTRPVGEATIVPPHQVLNQRNIIQSYERHLSNVPHTLTDFWSESEGITPQTSDPKFLDLVTVPAYTQLNESTPLVPSTQTYEVRRPTPVLVPVVSFNNPQDLMNSQAFVMNESEQRIELIVPDDVLYDSLQIIENDTGVPNLIAPFDDESQPYSLGAINYQETVCLTYDAATLPEQDPIAATPWTYQADQPRNVIRNVLDGVFTYGTTTGGAQTVYANATPLLDAPSLKTQVIFKLKLLADASLGLGDSQVRFGLSAPRMTLSLAFVTQLNGQRYVLLIDQNNGQVVGGIPFDFLDGNFHTYRIVLNPTYTPPIIPGQRVPPPPGPHGPLSGLLQVFIDS